MQFSKKVFFWNNLGGGEGVEVLEVEEFSPTPKPSVLNDTRNYAWLANRDNVLDVVSENVDLSEEFSNWNTSSETSNKKKEKIISGTANTTIWE